MDLSDSFFNAMKLIKDSQPEKAEIWVVEHAPDEGVLKMNVHAMRLETVTRCDTVFMVSPKNWESLKGDIETVKSGWLPYGIPVYTGEDLHRIFSSPSFRRRYSVLEDIMKYPE